MGLGWGLWLGLGLGLELGLGLGVGFHEGACLLPHEHDLPPRPPLRVASRGGSGGGPVKERRSWPLHMQREEGCDRGEG